jgi:hypothetical protein
MNQEIFKVENKEISTSLMISRMKDYGGFPEIVQRLETLQTLIDGAYDIVEIWNTETSQYNKEWKKQWLQAARECGAQPSP